MAVIFIQYISNSVVWLLANFPIKVCFADESHPNSILDIYHCNKSSFFHEFTTKYAFQLAQQHEFFVREIEVFKELVREKLPKEYACATDTQALAEYVRHLLQTDMRLTRFLTNVYWATIDVPISNHAILREACSLHIQLTNDFSRFVVRHPQIIIDPRFLETSPDMCLAYQSLVDFRLTIIESEKILGQVGALHERFDRMLINFVDNKGVAIPLIQQFQDIALANRTAQLDAQFGELAAFRRSDLKLGLGENRALNYELMARTFMQYMEATVCLHETQSYYMNVPGQGHGLSLKVRDLFNNHPPYSFKDSRGAVFMVSQENLRFLINAHDLKHVDYYKSVYDLWENRQRHAAQEFTEVIRGFKEDNLKLFRRYLELSAIQNELLAQYLVGQIDAELAQKLLRPHLDYANELLQARPRIMSGLGDHLEGIKTAQRAWFDTMTTSPDTGWWFLFLIVCSALGEQALFFLYTESYFPFIVFDDNDPRT